MALATLDDVAVSLGRDLTAAEEDAATPLLDTASDLVNGYLKWTVPDSVPGPVVRVVADMVAAVLLKPATSVADYAAGGYNTAAEPVPVRVGIESATSQGPWLTKSQKERLSPYYVGGVTSIGLSGETTGRFENEFRW